MTQKETRVQKIVRLTTKQFPSFGAGKLTAGNPISLALKNESPTFAAGVSIKQVVLFVLAKRIVLERVRLQKIGNDARDISHTSGLLKPLSNRDLGTIGQLKQREIRQRLRTKTSPFSGLSKETRKNLLHLPISWVHEGAQWQLNSRKPVRSLFS